MFERRTVFKAALAGGAGVFAAACSSGDGSSGGNQPPATSAAAPVAKLTAEPAVDAKNVPVLQPVTVKVTDGKLTDVKVTNADGKAVQGAFNADRTAWTTSESLGYGKTYTYAATATGSDNKPATLGGSFTTIDPANQVRVTVNPADDAEVGVGMPVSVKFTTDVTNKAAVEKALVIETGNKVEGSWGWLSDRQVDWRPKAYWPANTEVKVEAKLYGMDLGGGAYARADVTSSFKIGRNQVVKINTPDHVMNVYRNGSKTASYPCSNGLDSDVNRNTPNGTYIVMTKEPHAIFDNARYGYTNVNKKWACRISNHGEFIHENQDNAAAIGRTNNSHGCVNLLEADAKKYFDSALIGDPVEITGSRLGPVTTSDVMDWLIDWPTWKGKSAL
ncbi:L,D-transpeptidase [Amycolatopsis sp. K13G38]|uniref:L,D-transpeptidase n=1 Tax=Amycolatopsis acididurans TaxID=2724524 RepID=A0ABX1J714_9PSEU|nr:Ig-like domain-containing protein [Amycolatopsis acididurans]NKQ55091.1 L,D-transpeptidase [Amycolatopsis acididurans]